MCGNIFPAICKIVDWQVSSLLTVSNCITAVTHQTENYLFSSIKKHSQPTNATFWQGAFFFRTSCGYWVCILHQEFLGKSVSIPVVAIQATSLVDCYFRFFHSPSQHVLLKRLLTSKTYLAKVDRSPPKRSAISQPPGSHFRFLRFSWMELSN